MSVRRGLTLHPLSAGATMTSSTTTTTATPAPELAAGQAATAGNRGKWMALIAALLGWMFDGFEMGMFPLVGQPTLMELLAPAIPAGAHRARGRFRCERSGGHKGRASRAGLSLPAAPAEPIPACSRNRLPTSGTRAPSAAGAFPRCQRYLRTSARRSAALASARALSPFASAIPVLCFPKRFFCRRRALR